MIKSKSRSYVLHRPEATFSKVASFQQTVILDANFCSSSTGCSLKITLLLRHNISRHPSVSIGEESLLHAYVHNTEYKCTLMFILKCKQNIHDRCSLIGAMIYHFLRGRDY